MNRKRKAIGALDLRLGWLETYLAVAHHRDYQLAARELGISADQVRRTIGYLEKWSRRELIISGNTVEPSDPDGDLFVLLAVNVLTALGAGTKDFDVARWDIAHRRRSKLRLYDLKILSEAFASGTYQRVDDEANITSSIRNVRSVEQALGRKLLTGRNPLKIAPGAEPYFYIVRRVLEKLADFRISDHDMLVNFRKLVLKHRTLMRANISVWEKRKKLAPQAKRDLAEVKEKLEVLDRVEKDLESLLGPSRSVSGADIDMSAFFAEREQEKA